MHKCLSCIFILLLNLTPPILLQAKAHHGNDEHREKLLHLFSGEWISRAIYVAVKLDIPDILCSGPKTVEELSTLSSTNSDSLYRLLHMLAGHGIFQEKENKIFTHTEKSALLTKSHPDSLQSLCLFYGEDIHRAWDSLLPSIQKGMPAFQLSFQEPVFHFFKNNPKRAALFQAAMREKSQAVIQSALSAYDFTPFHTIYDIGGGKGHFLTALLQKFPNLSATLFELPEVISSLEKTTTPFALSSGDFFKALPANGDLYLMKSVLHDWDDNQAIQILRNCSKAMNEKSRLLIIEIVLQPGNSSLYANSMDLLMLAITGGKERSLSSFEKMLDASGLILENIYPTSTEFSILEVKKCQEMNLPRFD